MDDRSLLHGLATVGVVYLLVLSPSYWPWYAILPLALLALLPQSLPIVLAAALSLGARLAAPLDLLFEHGTIGRSSFLLGTWLLGIGMPSVAAAVAVVIHPGSRVTWRSLIPVPRLRVRERADTHPE